MLPKLKTLFNYNEKELNRIKKIVQRINSVNLSTLSDDDLKHETESLRSKLASGESLDSILPQAFAVVREASSRVLLKRHFDVQLIGGIVLHEGNVAEMKTGEGKTLVGTLPTYLNALSGTSVHVITVNEYLAQRDYEELTPLFRFLGLTTSYIHAEMTPEEKQQAYKASVIYGTNNEFGFDYLRDNMVKRLEDKVQGELGFAIVDEVDSILIDESRTPLVISGKTNDTAKLLYNTNALVSTFTKDKHYEIDATTEQCFLTEDGISKAENFFKINNLYAPESNNIMHFLNQSIRAHAVMKKDKDYIVHDNEVHIIDTFTGRISHGRRFSNSLHQAIEVKEGVTMKDETITKATITFQNYFRMYHKLSGMTGTADTEKEELMQVYGMNTVVIPTNKPVQRIDQTELIFSTKEAKKKSILTKIKQLHEQGQPILIGTSTIEESEEYSSMLQDSNIQHVVLNAKNHEKEADIIANAGKKYAITVATNMAGRGTDIKLGDGVCELGGLFILGTSKNENRRIDNQLRGRSGRQGDPGLSQFYISLEDDLMLRFGADRAKNALSKITGLDEEGLSSGFLMKIFENAQKQLEGSNYDARKRLLQYDDVLNRQRTLIYQERVKLMSQDDLKPTLSQLFDSFVEETVFAHFENSVANEKEIQSIHDYFSSITKKALNELPPSTSANREDVIKHYQIELKDSLNTNLIHLPSDFENEIYKDIMLNNIDLQWEKHLEILDDIRQGIHLQSYSQTDPLRAYEERASDEFNVLLKQFNYAVVATLFSLKFQMNTN